MSLAIDVLIDYPECYLHGHISGLLETIRARGHTARLFSNQKELQPGDILFILGCKDILPTPLLSLHKHNLVVHPSKLPEGRGHAALVSKILEGENTVYLTLFEAIEQVDAGGYYYQEPLHFEGHELSDEIRKAQAMKTFELVLRFIDGYPNVPPKPQVGTPTYIKRRTLQDSELDIDTTIRDQFNLLRIVDNERYPAFFSHKGHTYILHIFKGDNGRLP